MFVIVHSCLELLARLTSCLPMSSFHSVFIRRLIALHPSFVNLCMPQNSSLVLLISEPIRVNDFFFVIDKSESSIPNSVVTVVATTGSQRFDSKLLGHWRRAQTFATPLSSTGHANMRIAISIHDLLQSHIRLLNDMEVTSGPSSFYLVFSSRTGSW